MKTQKPEQSPNASIKYPQDQPVESESERKEAPSNFVQGNSYLKFLYQQCDGGSVNLRLLHKDGDPKKTKSLFIPLSDIGSSIQKILTDYSPDYSVYFGIATRTEGDGTKSGIRQIPALWTDLDIYKLTDEQKATSRQRYKDFPLRATSTINSGGGRYLLWALKEPVGNEDIARVENLLKRLAAHFNGDPGATDASRIIRVPGGINHKYSHHPIVSIVKSYPDRQYSLEDFDSILPALTGGIPGSGGDRPPVGWEKELLEGVSEGERNIGIARLSGRYVGKGLSREEILLLLLAVNERFIPPLPDHEVEACLDSVLKTHQRNHPEQKISGGHDEEIPRDDSNFSESDLGCSPKDKPAGDNGTKIDDEEKMELLSKDFSDTENARRFLKLQRNVFLWIEDLKEWWNFSPDRPGWGDGEMAVRSRMKEAANMVNKAALEMPFTDDKQRLEKLKKCIVWKSANGIENSIKMLRDEGYARSTDFDINPFLFLCKSGVINLTTRKLKSPSPSDRLRKMSPVKFDPKAKCPQWIQFLKDTFLNNLELIFFIQKFCGYTLTGNAGEEKFLVLEGPGSNGKSTLLEVIAGVLGEYGLPVPFATFKDPKWDQGGNAHQADMVQMIGARFIRSVEIKEKARLNIERLKSLTGKDEMSARPPYSRDYIKFKPTGKIWLAVNHLPRIYDTSHACWRRLLRIPFLYTVPADKEVKDFSDQLLQEESLGILNWMLDGCYVWQKEGLEPIPSIVTNATEEYRLESTPVKRFISEKCETGKFQITCGDLYTSFVSWWKEEMGEITPMSKMEFGREIKQMGFDIRKIGNVKHYIGLRQKMGFN